MLQERGRRRRKREREEDARRGIGSEGERSTIMKREYEGDGEEGKRNEDDGKGYAV